MGEDDPELLIAFQERRGGGGRGGHGVREIAEASPGIQGEPPGRSLPCSHRRQEVGPPQGGPPHSSARRAAVAQLWCWGMLTPTTS